jgi:peptide/nickel transport system substrate-binding protein
MKMIRLLGVVATGMSAMMVIAMAGLAPHAVRATEADTLVLGKSGDPDNLDPAVTVTNNSWTAVYPCYERLVKFKVVDGKGTTNVEGDVATSWTASDDGKVWTFTLGDGHVFADGTPVDAAAVKSSFERVLKVGKGPADAYDQVGSVEAVDDHTVRFTLQSPFAPFLASLVTDAGSIVNPAVMSHESGGDLGQAYLADHTMGSGSYQVNSWEKGQQILLEPNPHHAGKVGFKKVIIRIVKEASARRLQLEKGDLDIAEDIPIDQLKALETAPGVNVVDEPSFSVTYLYLNNTHKPLDDVRVRQGISYAIDYKGIISSILQGQGVQMQGPVPVGMWAHDDQAMQYEFNLDKAKALMKEAGVNGADLGYLYAKTDPDWEPLGLIVQQELAPIGIKVKLQEFAYPTMREKLDKGDFDIAVGNWTPDYADPSMFMNFWFDSGSHGLAGNRAFYTNPKVDELIRKAKATASQEERTKLYDEAQKIVIAEAPYVLLFQKNYQFAMRDDVKGYVYNPMLLQIFDFASMSK